MSRHPPAGRRARWREVLRHAVTALGDGARRLAERLAYRPREVTIVTLLATGLLGGLAVARWREAYPALAVRLETEPARLVAPAASAARGRPRPAPRGAPRDCGESRDGSGGSSDARPPEPPEPAP